MRFLKCIPESTRKARAVDDGRGRGAPTPSPPPESGTGLRGGYRSRDERGDERAGVARFGSDPSKGWPRAAVFKGPPPGRRVGRRRNGSALPLADLGSLSQDRPLPGSPPTRSFKRADRLRPSINPRPVAALHTPGHTSKRARDDRFTHPRRRNQWRPTIRNSQAADDTIRTTKTPLITGKCTTATTRGQWRTGGGLGTKPLRNRKK